MRSVYPRGKDLSLHVSQSSLVTALCYRLGQLQVSLTYLVCPLARWCKWIEAEIWPHYIANVLPMFDRLLYTGWPLKWASKERSRTIWHLVVVALQFKGTTSRVPQTFRNLRVKSGKTCSRTCLNAWEIVAYITLASIFAGNRFFLLCNHISMYEYITPSQSSKHSIF